MSNFELSNKDWKELIKLYPEIKIPYLKEAEYYIEQLAKTDDSVYKKISWYTQLKDQEENVSSYKMQFGDRLIGFFIENKYLEKFNEIEIPTSDWYSKNSKFEAGKKYVSIDLKQANYNAFLYGLNYPDKLNDNWEGLMRECQAPELLVNSKSFRQYIMGNINPKRQVSIQKYMISKICTILTNYGINTTMVSTDEVVFEDNVEDGIIENIMERVEREIELPVALNRFSMFYFNHYNEEVAVKYINGKKNKFYAIQGNRYFIHYAKIFLNREPEERDLYFEPEPGKLAKWVL